MLINPLILCETGMEIEQGFWQEIGYIGGAVLAAEHGWRSDVQPFLPAGETGIPLRDSQAS